MRERLDLETIELPLALAAVSLPLTPSYVERVVRSLGEAAKSSRELQGLGFVPPHAVTGNTIHLLASHYDIAGGVYSREQVTYLRPLRIGEVLSVSGELARTSLKRGRRYRTMTSISRGEDGEIAVRSRSTGVERYLLAEGDSGREAGRDERELEEPGPAAPLRLNPSREALALLQPGARIEAGPARVTLEQMRELAGREDPNPIHTDPERARAEGLGAPIAGGPHVLAHVQEALMDALGPFALLHGAHFDVRWIKPVRAGSAVSAFAEVVAGSGLVQFELGVDCEGERALVGRAEIPLGAGP